MGKVCTKCGKWKSIDRFYTKNHKCKFCKWLEKQDLTVIPDTWELRDILTMLELIYDQKVEYINDITKHIDKSLVNIIAILTEKIKIANVRMRVLIECANCGKKKETFMCKVINSNFQFCGHKCYSEFRKKYYVGAKASVYKSTEEECSHCRKTICVAPYKKRIKNNEGKNHHFCSHDCYSKFRKEYYTGDKLYNTGLKLSENARRLMSQRTTEMYERGVFNRQTKPQKIANSILDSLKVSYRNEKSYKYYAVDNYLQDHNLVIEVMGDYFHANPTKYKDASVLNKMQLKSIPRDKRKNTYLLKYYGIRILYLWEHDLIKRRDVCTELVKKYIEGKGLLENYHSYNYSLCNGKLILNDNIINPISQKNP